MSVEGACVRATGSEPVLSAWNDRWASSRTFRLSLGAFDQVLSRPVVSELSSGSAVGIEWTPEVHSKGSRQWANRGGAIVLEMRASCGRLYRPSVLLYARPPETFHQKIICQWSVSFCQWSVVSCQLP